MLPSCQSTTKRGSLYYLQDTLILAISLALIPIAAHTGFFVKLLLVRRL